MQARVDLQYRHRVMRAGSVFTIEEHEFRPRQMALVTEAQPAIDSAAFVKPALPFPDKAKVREVPRGTVPPANSRVLT